MSRTAARFIQSDIARSIRAARQAGAAGVDLLPDGSISDPRKVALFADVDVGILHATLRKYRALAAILSDSQEWVEFEEVRGPAPNLPPQDPRLPKYLDVVFVRSNHKRS